MSDKLTIIEISIPHFTAEGTFHAAMSAAKDVADAGFNTVLALPFMPIDRNLSRSPYAVIDYTSVDSAMGTTDDVRAWIHHCHALGLDVVLDIPLNHTSPAHAWKLRDDWYSRDASGNAHAPVGTNWSDVHQLNHSHAPLVEELQQVLAFWLELGCDGFRYDAAAWMTNACLDALIQGVNLLANRRMHHWCDSAVMMNKHPFTAFLDCESYRALMTEKSDENWYASIHENAILYLANHDTLNDGRSAIDVLGNRYHVLRELLQSGKHHRMQSACEWRNPSASYSFLR